MKWLVIGILVVGALGAAGYALSNVASEDRRTTYTLAELQAPPESPGAILRLNASMVAALPEPARSGFEAALREGRGVFILTPAEERAYHQVIAGFAREQGKPAPAFFEMDGRFFSQASLA